MSAPFTILNSQFIINYSPPPFGEYRIDPPDPADDITDRGFTGHKHNDDIGLIYMNARYYVGAIGRFASADTIVPYPTNPQSFNRYSYVRNNPLNLVDPSGHNDECPDDDCHSDPSPPPEPEPEPEPEEEIDDCLKPPACEPPPTPWGPPMEGDIKWTRGLSWDANGNINHKGIDIYSHVGANLLAIGTGTVVEVGSDEDEYGNFIIIEYLWENIPPEVRELIKETMPDFGPGKSIYVQYQHMAGMAADENGNLLSVGQTVSVGQVVGQQGNSGNSDNDHLHLQIHIADSNYFNEENPWTHKAWNNLTIFDPNIIWNYGN